MREDCEECWKCSKVGVWARRARGADSLAGPTGLWDSGVYGDRRLEGAGLVGGHGGADERDVGTHRREHGRRRIRQRARHGSEGCHCHL